MFILYSTGCPKCNVLLTKLQQKKQIPNKDFELVEDEQEVLKVAQDHNIQTVPFIIDGDNVYLFADAVKFINKIGA